MTEERAHPEIVALRSALSDAMTREMNLRMQLVSAHYEIADLRERLKPVGDGDNVVELRTDQA
jgi:hypothetical protein